MKARSPIDVLLRMRAIRWISRAEAFDPSIPVPRASQEEKFKGFAHSFQWFISALGRMPNKHWTVLEAGHGSSGYARFYAQVFQNVHGIDIKDYSSFHPRVVSLVGDLTKFIPLPSSSIDLVVSHSVLEHVSNVEATLRNLDRVLKLGGYAFITVYGLYPSPEGAHVRSPDLHYKNWEHLDPSSPYYLLDSSPNSSSPMAGHLNRYRFADFMAAFGQVPWDIVKITRSYDDRPIPAYVDMKRFDELDLRTRGFKLLARKTREA